MDDLGIDAMPYEVHESFHLERNYRSTIMPYIEENKRLDFDENYFEEFLQNGLPHDVGELNYIITTLIVNYLGVTKKYEKYNEVIGVLECAKLELYRRAVSPYEDAKMKENGDVY